MASFRDAAPRIAPVMMVLFLLMCRPMGLRASQEHEIGEMENNPEIAAQRAELQRLVDELRSVMPAGEGAGRGLLSTTPSAGSLASGFASSLGKGLSGLGTGSNIASVLGALPRQTTASETNIASMLSNFATIPNPFTALGGGSPSSVLGLPGLMQGISTDPLLQGLINGDPLAGILGGPTPPLDPALEAALNGSSADPVAIATLGLLSGIMNLVSSILYTVSGGLGTAAASLGLIPASLGTITGPIGFGLSSASFGLVLSQDSSVDSAVQRWQLVVNQLADRLGELSNGTVLGSIRNYQGQLGRASGLLESVQARFNPT
ncbi:hypothetical protein QJQ45_002486 [Haematococcus lacustris]|nr:hypothetical protein QJQ45_002486 [Haematococcus lacustris]